MFCLRSWLPLLFIPTNASPLFIISFVVLTYILHRPCIYCSALLLILFISSCHWSDRCFIDFTSDWFAPRYGNQAALAPTNTTQAPSDDLAKYVVETVNSTVTALATAAYEETKKRLTSGEATAPVGGQDPEWTGVGLEWLRSLLGRKEWTLPCLDVKVRL